MSDYTTIGKRYPLKDAKVKVTGAAKFGDDLTFPQMLYGAILRSPHPHARILNIDTSKAERLVGVKGVITGKDTAGMATKAAPFGRKDYQEIMALDKVRFRGEPVAALAAIDEEVAAEALELIRVEYEELPAVFDPEEAMKPGAPLIHDHAPNNILGEAALGCGDVEEGFRASDYVREDRFVTSRVTHGFMEPHVVTFTCDASGKLTFYASKMGMNRCLPGIVPMLGVSEGDVRVIKPYVGGAFGGKNFVMAHDPMAALLSINTGRPVRMALSREEVFYNLCKAPVIIYLKTGIKKDGTLMAIEATAIADGGAYEGVGISTAFHAGKYLSLPYRVPHFRYKGYRVYTNNLVGGAQRAVGGPQPRFAAEIQMDMLAKEIGMDPVEVRLKNLQEPGDVTSLGVKLKSCGLRECIEKVAEAIGWREKWNRPGNRGVGIGVGCFHAGQSSVPFPGFKMPYRPPTRVDVRLHEGGRISVYTPTKDAGQGGDTAMCQVAAEVLGVPLEDVEIYSRDSAYWPSDRLGSSNCDAYSLGRATYQAAHDLRKQMFKVIADNLECNPQDLESKGGRINVKGSPDKGLSFSEAALAVFAAKGPVLGRGAWVSEVADTVERLRAKGDVNTSPTYGFNAYGAEVEVDPETGQVKLVKIIGALDVGLAINPMIVEGQIEGGISMGVGYATEEVIKDKEGQILNPSLLDYRMATVLDTQDISSIIVEATHPDEGPFGAKEAGEGSSVAIAPAIVNAIYDAVGVWISEGPIAPERILRALEKKG